MTRSTPSLLIVLVMITSSMLGVVSWVPQPASALTFDVDTTEDLLGTGSNLAILDKVAVADDRISLDTEVYEIDDTAWSDANTYQMVVDNQNLPKLDLASHWSMNSGYGNDGDFAQTAVFDRVRSNVIVYGGAHDRGTTRNIHNAAWTYNPGSQVWTAKAPAPRAKLGHTAVWADDYQMMIVWGGETFVTDRMYLLAETMVYWPANDTWAFGASCPYGGKRWHTSVWDSENDQMLVMGGVQDFFGFENATGDLWAYKPSTNSWSTLPSIPSTFERAGAASVWDTQSDQMIVYGGRKGDNNPMYSVYSYKPSTRTWTSRGTADVARIFHSMWWDPVNNKAYSFGGYTGSAISSRFYEYSPLPNTWVRKESAPGIVGQPGARMWSPFVWDSSRSLGLVFAGATDTSFPIGSTNDVMEFQVEVPFETEGWLTSPYFDLGGILSMGQLSWGPASQPTSCGPDAVMFQVASSSSLEVPTDFVGPDGTSNTYFKDPSGTDVGDHHFGAGRIAYRMYFHTDDDTITPIIDEVSLRVIRYSTKGTYTSPIYDLGQVRSTMDHITYRSQIPPDVNTNLVKVTVKVRTSQSSDMSGASSWETVDKDDSSINTPYGQYFQFQVIINTNSQGRHLTPTFSGISIEYNTPPVLTGGLIDKIDGDRTTWFTYTITYTDVDNDEPTVKNIYIDGIPHTMSSPDLDFTNGAPYSFEKLLSLGEHEFFFEFSDGKNTVRDPPVGVFTGPEIFNRDPVPLIDFPTTGSRFVPNEPIEFSSASSFDPDEDGITFRWISSAQGELSTSDSFVKNLIEGEHLITLEITDDFGSRNTTQISITVKPFLPYLEIREFYLDKVNAVVKDRITVNAVVHNEGEATASPAIVEFLVNDEVVDSVEQQLDMGDRMVTTFYWTAEGEKSFLSVRTRPGHDASIDEVKIRTVNVSANTPPVIMFDVYPSIIFVDEAVNFINNGTDDANGDSLTYLWDFGDGATSSDASTQHLYVFEGTFVAKLTVTDTRDGQTFKEWTILVEEVPEDESSSLSMVMIGGIAVAIIVVLLLVVFLMRGRKKEPSPRPDAGPLNDPAARPVPPPPPGDDPGHAPGYDPTPATGYDPSPTPEEGPGPASEYDPSPAIEYDPTPASEGDPSPTPEEEPGPATEGDPSPTPEEEPGPATEDDPNPAAEEVPEADIGTEEEPPQET